MLISTSSGQLPDSSDVHQHGGWSIHFRQPAKFVMSFYALFTNGKMEPMELYVSGRSQIAGKRERLPRAEIAGCLRLFVVVVVMK